MFSWFKTLWNNFQDYQTASRQTSPETLLDLSREVRALAQVVDRFWIEEPGFRHQLHKIEQEMQILEQFITRPKFHLLSPEKRLQLRENLLQSREHLLQAAREAPTASDRLQ
jgi:hypothetical protein